MFRRILGPPQWPQQAQVEKNNVSAKKHQCFGESKDRPNGRNKRRSKKTMFQQKTLMFRRILGPPQWLQRAQVEKSNVSAKNINVLVNPRIGVMAATREGGKKHTVAKSITNSIQSERDQNRCAKPMLFSSRSASFSLTPCPGREDQAPPTGIA